MDYMREGAYSVGLGVFLMAGVPQDLVHLWAVSNGMGRRRWVH